jgi:hypothetical protein
MYSQAQWGRMREEYILCAMGNHPTLSSGPWDRHFGLHQCWRARRQRRANITVHAIIESLLPLAFRLQVCSMSSTVGCQRINRCRMIDKYYISTINHEICMRLKGAAGPRAVRITLHRAMERSTAGNQRLANLNKGPSIVFQNHLSSGNVSKIKRFSWYITTRKAPTLSAETLLAGCEVALVFFHSYTQTVHDKLSIHTMT